MSDSHTPAGEEASWPPPDTHWSPPPPAAEPSHDAESSAWPPPEGSVDPVHGGQAHDHEQGGPYRTENDLAVHAPYGYPSLPAPAPWPESEGPSQQWAGQPHDGQSGPPQPYSAPPPPTSYSQPPDAGSAVPAPYSAPPPPAAYASAPPPATYSAPPAPAPYAAAPPPVPYTAPPSSAQQQPAPYQPAPYQPAPYQPAPYQPAPYQPAPYQPVQNGYAAPEYDPYPPPVDAYGAPAEAYPPQYDAPSWDAPQPRQWESPRWQNYLPTYPQRADLPPGGQAETITCPECGAVQTISVNRRDSEDFCTNCDYPLFWTPSTLQYDRGEMGDQSLRRLPGTVGRATLASVPCPHCAELNTVQAVVCVRCGLPMHHIPEAPTIYLPPPPPPPVYVEPKTGVAWWVWLLIALTFVTTVVLIVLVLTHKIG